MAASCTCETCQDMCHEPCWPTPYEAKKLINEGFGDRLMLDSWISFSGNFFDYRRINVLCPATKHWPNCNSRCIFQDIDTKLCQLHDLQLKPLEGRMADCKNSSQDGISLRNFVGTMWDSLEGQELVSEWKRTFAHD